MTMSRHHALSTCLAACLLLAWLGGCRSTPPAHQIRDIEFAQVEAAVAEAWHPPQPVVVQSPVAPELSGPQPVETYIGYALSQNPEIHAARKQVEAQAQRVPQAASLEDPMLEVSPFLAPMHMGEMQQVIQMGVSQQVPWFGKLRTRAELAEQEAERARAELAAAQLEIVEQVKLAYYELYFVQRAIQITEEDRELLRALLEIAGARFRVGQVSQQDVLRAELQLLDLENQLVELRQQLASAQARLARRLSLSPETQVQALDQLPPEQIPQDVHRLYEQAIAARPELHAQLADLMRERRNVDLARLNYYPDVRLSGMWMGMDAPEDGMNVGMSARDAFQLGVGVNLPIYRKRLDAGVWEAEARVVSTARRYDALRDQTQEEVKDLFAQIQSQQELLRLLREEIVPKAEQTFEVSLRAYEVGDVTFLELLDNWQQLLRFQISMHRLESQLRQSLARLERLLGGPACLEAAVAEPLQEPLPPPPPPPPADIPPAPPA